MAGQPVGIIIVIIITIKISLVVITVITIILMFRWPDSLVRIVGMSVTPVVVDTQSSRLIIMVSMMMMMQNVGHHFIYHDGYDDGK